tara:strand:+ start:1801 stop:2295 length:495 start_codon:yes stop_codon:yes gene_type:complete
MANIKLRHKHFKIPEEVLSALKTGHAGYRGPKKVEGWIRTQNLLEDKNVSYELLKKIKHFFDNTDPSANYALFNLNGGELMQSWVAKTLKYARDYVKRAKKNKSVTSTKNQFRKAHTKEPTTTTAKSRTERIPKTRDEIEQGRGAYKENEEHIKNIIFEFINNK